MKGKILIKIKNEVEPYKDIEVATWQEAERKVIEAMSEIQITSPFVFTHIEPYGHSMVDTEGRLWEFRFVENEKVDSYINKVKEKAERIALYDSLTEEDKKDIIEVDGKRYIRKMYNIRRKAE